jgi:energy-converting hydrogenase Eha subunit H
LDLEATRRECEMQFSAVGAQRRGGSGNAGFIAVEVKLFKSDGSTFWMVFHLRFEAVADRIGWEVQKKTTHPLTIMDG